MDRARAAAEQGDTKRLWIVAGEQTGGRGRDGRTWSSPPGNLYASCLLVEACDPARAPELGFVAGLALIEALGAAPGLALKWPNDLLYDGAKMAGILLEGWRRRDTRFCCTIGLGLNCQFYPTGLPYAATSLRDAGLLDDPGAVFPKLADHLAVWLQRWQTDGFAPVRERWLTHAAHLGRTLEVTGAGPRRSGRFTTIDAAGRLILIDDTTVHVIAAGDIFPMRDREPAEPLVES